MAKNMKISIIGLGLIGGSIASSIKQHEKIAYDIDENALKYAKNIGLIDHYSTNLETVVQNADIIVVAVPLAEYPSIFLKLSSCITPNQLITDVCSVKNEVVSVSKKFLGRASSQFVPAHPISGSEKAKVQNFKPDLFLNQHVIITPLKENSLKSIKTISSFWEDMGAIVKIMSPKEHDKVLAATSHFPHIISFAYASMFSKRKNMTEFSSGSFRDMTRISNSSKEFWADILMANRKALLKEISTFQEHLNKISLSLKNNDISLLKKLLKK